MKADLSCLSARTKLMPLRYKIVVEYSMDMAFGPNYSVSELDLYTHAGLSTYHVHRISQP